MADVQLTAYNVKTKEKGVPILNAKIKKTAKGAFMVQGDDGKGNPLTTLCNREKAIAAVNAGIATAEGWNLAEETGRLPKTEPKTDANASQSSEPAAENAGDTDTE
jgi:hypothetical protein